MIQLFFGKQRKMKQTSTEIALSSFFYPAMLSFIQINCSGLIQMSSSMAEHFSTGRRSCDLSMAHIEKGLQTGCPFFKIEKKQKKRGAGGILSFFSKNIKDLFRRQKNDRISNVKIKCWDSGLQCHKNSSHFHRTALHFACVYGRLPVVNVLVNNNCEIDALDKNHITPLMKVGFCP